MDADAQPAAVPRCRHAGRLHGMVELIDTSRYSLHELSAGVCQPDAPRMTLEQEDTKVLLQRLHAGTDA